MSGKSKTRSYGGKMKSRSPWVIDEIAKFQTLKGNSATGRKTFRKPGDSKTIDVVHELERFQVKLKVNSGRRVIGDFLL